MSESEASIEINPSINYRKQCLNFGNHILLIIYRFLSDCLICRLLSFIFTIQAGIIWLGCKSTSSLFHQIIWFVLFIIWFIVFDRIWPPEKDQCIRSFIRKKIETIDYL
jgi:hypothetical protein